MSVPAVAPRAGLSRADVTSHQLASTHSLLYAMTDRQRYDGRYDLAGDRDMAGRLGFSVEDTTAMARFYAVPLSRYEAGRAVPA